VIRFKRKRFEQRTIAHLFGCELRRGSGARRRAFANVFVGLAQARGIRVGPDPTIFYVSCGYPFCGWCVKYSTVFLCVLIYFLYSF
jgi:hypothetical protein